MSEYKYTSIPITPSIIEDLISVLFNGVIAKRQLIVEKVLEFHISNGGSAPESKNFTNSVKKALKNLEKKDHAKNISFGNWRIQFNNKPVIDEDENEDEVEAADEVINNLKNHRTFGVGSFAIYCYYFNSYKELANLEGKDSWPCKIGRTDRDPLIRVLSQASTALPEEPTIDFVVRTNNSSVLETAIHSALKLRGKHIKESPGSEWFITSPEEVIDLIKGINKDILNDSN